MKKIGILSLIVLMPNFVFADGGANSAVLYVKIILILLGLGIAALISSFFYLKKGSNWLFYLSAIPAAIIFAFISLFMAATSGRKDSLHNLIILLPLIIFAIVFYKKHKDNPLQIFWYYAMNTTSILLLSSLLYAVNNYALSFIYLKYVFYAFYVFLYVRTTLKNVKLISTTKLYFNASLICFLSFLTINLFYMFTTTHLKYIVADFIHNIGQFFIGLLIAIVISNISSFATIKNYR